MDAQQVEYCEEVMKFRKVLNLTSIKDIHVFYKRFIIPSIALSQWINDGDVVLDIGSGMGIPGLPLLIHQPNIRGILVERRMKRTEFIRHVIRKLKLNGEAYDADINDMSPLKASVCVARAVSEVQQLISMCDQHIVAGGKAVLSVPDEAKLPIVDGWELKEDFKKNGVQRVACYVKDTKDLGGVSRET